MASLPQFEGNERLLVDPLHEAGAERPVHFDGGAELSCAAAVTSASSST